MASKVKDVPKPAGPSIRKSIKIETDDALRASLVVEELEPEYNFAGYTIGWEWTEGKEITLGGFEALDEYSCCCGVDILVGIFPENKLATVKALKQLIEAIKIDSGVVITSTFTEDQIKQSPKTISAMKACGFKQSPSWRNPSTGAILTMFNYYPPMAPKGKK